MASILPALLQLAGATGAGIAQGRTVRRQNRIEDDKIARENAILDWTRQRQAEQDRMARESHALQVLSALAPGSRILPGRAPQSASEYPEGSAAGALGAAGARAGANALGPSPLTGASPLPSTSRANTDRYVQSGDYYADTEAPDPKSARDLQRRIEAQRALRAQFPDMVPGQDMPGVDWGAQFGSLMNAQTARVNAAQSAKDRAQALLATIRGQDIAHADRGAALDFQRKKEAWDEAHPKSTMSMAEAKRQEKAAAALSANNQVLRTLDMVEASVAKNPTAFGLRNTGVGRVVGALGGTGDLYESRVGTDSKTAAAHRDARALVSRLGSVQIHNLTGAAMAAQEWERLKGSIPTNTEHSAAILSKLRAMRKVIQQENEAISMTYGVENPDASGAMAHQAAPVTPADEALAKRDPGYAQWLQTRGQRP